jgi:hypothetical protein
MRKILIVLSVLAFWCGDASAQVINATKVDLTRNGLNATTLPAVNAHNDTPATALVPVQVSPSVTMRGNRWSGAASLNSGFDIYSVPGGVGGWTGAELNFDFPNTQLEGWYGGKRNWLQFLFTGSEGPTLLCGGAGWACTIGYEGGVAGSSILYGASGVSYVNGFTFAPRTNDQTILGTAALRWQNLYTSRGFQTGSTLANRPACDVTTVGRLYNILGAAGVADEWYVCVKNAADVYSWQQWFSGASTSESVVYTADLDLSNAQTKVLNATPVQILAAPPAGYYYEFVSFSARMVYATAIFDSVGATETVSMYDAAANLMASCPDATGFGDSAVTISQLCVLQLGGLGEAGMPTTAITVKIDNGEWYAAAGGGALHFQLLYRIRTLAI